MQACHHTPAACPQTHSCLRGGGSRRLEVRGPGTHQSCFCAFPATAERATKEPEPNKTGGRLQLMQAFHHTPAACPQTHPCPRGEAQRAPGKSCCCAFQPRANHGSANAEQNRGRPKGTKTLRQNPAAPPQTHSRLRGSALRESTQELFVFVKSASTDLRLTGSA
jgi:hypothetical protein